jgi:hypothetical protein
MADPKYDPRKNAPILNDPVDKTEPKVKHVKMRRSHPQHPGGPLTADVHPDEVANYSQHGWLKE